MKTGKVKSVNLSKKKGTKKLPAKEIFVIKGGVKGDAHFGEDREVSILSWEEVKEFQKKYPRLKILPGAFAENVTLEGISLKNVRPGDIFQFNKVSLLISQIGKPCHSGCAIKKSTGSCLMPSRGVFGRVTRKGKIKPGDKLKIKEKPGFAVLVISDSCFKGKREDTAGRKIITILEGKNYSFLDSRIVPDDEKKIKNELNSWIIKKIPLIFTCGGTGIGPRDITPEATEEVIEKNIPGIEEILRMEGYRKTPSAVLSRGHAGIKDKSLIFNLPGSEKGGSETLEVLIPLLPHSLDMLYGKGH